MLSNVFLLPAIGTTELLILMAVVALFIFSLFGKKLIQGFKR